MSQVDLFHTNQISKTSQPLAEEMRPVSLDDYAGQEKLVGENGIIRRMIEQDKITSMIFWGPPGVGKTTLARIIANETKSKFIQMSAVTSGKAEMQNVVKQAKEISQAYAGRKTILFIDEIHRFNKAQQDFLLPYVEDGTLILIGATTENPSFEVISALLSRCRVFTLEHHKKDDLKKIIDRALLFMKEKRDIDVQFDSEDSVNLLIAKSNGDPRTLLNALEIAVSLG